MKRWRSHFVALVIAMGLLATSSQTMALTDTYFVTGQDLDLIMESDKTYAMEELEYELRKIPLFQEVEDLIFNFEDEYVIEDE